MPGFADAVQQAQRWWQHQTPDPALKAAQGRADMPSEASRVHDCVARFTRAEVDGVAVGRYGSVKAFPPLRDLAGDKLDAANQQQLAREAIAKALALGYVFMASNEEEGAAGRLDRSPRDVWEVWAPGINSGLAQQTAIPDDLLSMVRQAGGNVFRDDAVALGLGGFGKKVKLEGVGAMYAQAGLVLRAVQVHPGDLQPDADNIWQYDELPV